jgi:hypothetical protein
MHTTLHDIKLFLIKRPPEIEVQLQDTPIESTPEPSSMPILPRMTDDPKCDILIWRTCREYDELGIIVPRNSLESVNRGFGFIAVNQHENQDGIQRDVHEIWIEDIEFVSLNNFWWGILGTVISTALNLAMGRDLLIVCLIILIPLKPSLDTIEEPRFSRSISITPIVVTSCRCQIESFIQISKLLLAFVRPKIFLFLLGFCSIDRFGF